MMLLWIELAIVAIIPLIFVATTFAFKPEHVGHGPRDVRLGAALQGLILGLLIGFVLLPLRMAFLVPEDGLPEAPRGGMATLSLLPFLILVIIVRRGLLARAPLIGRYIRAFRKASLKFQINGAQKVLARLEGIDAGKIKD